MYLSEYLNQQIPLQGQLHGSCCELFYLIFITIFLFCPWRKDMWTQSGPVAFPYSQISWSKTRFALHQSNNFLFSSLLPAVKSIASPLQCWLNELPPTFWLSNVHLKNDPIRIGLPYHCRSGSKQTDATILIANSWCSVGVFSIPKRMAVGETVASLYVICSEMFIKKKGSVSWICFARNSNNSNRLNCDSAVM